VAFKTYPSVRVYERGGELSSTIVLLPVEAAAQLTAELQLALASPESQALASWPREVCTFPVSPRTRGREQYISIHLDAGAQPYSTWALRRRAALSTLYFALGIIGAITVLRLLLSVVGA
jgi:hypothetical protein